MKMGFEQDGEAIIVVGETRCELGGSEYYRALGFRGNTPPALNFEVEVHTTKAVLECIRRGWVTACHDISKGGLGVALAEMAVAGGKGATVDCRLLAAEKMRDDQLLFSETNSRFILTTNKPSQVLQALSKANVSANVAGTVGGNTLHLILSSSKLDFEIQALHEAYVNSIQGILEPWQK